MIASALLVLEVLAALVIVTSPRLLRSLGAAAIALAEAQEVFLTTFRVRATHWRFITASLGENTTERRTECLTQNNSLIRK